MKPLLGDLAIIESSGDGFRYRLYSSYIGARCGEDRTGQHISEKNAGMARFLNAAYRAAIVCRELLFTRRRPPLKSRVTVCQRLLMPFACNGTANIHVNADLAFALDRASYGPLGESE